MINTALKKIPSSPVTGISNYSMHKKYRGFTIFELMIVLAISAAIGIQLLPEAALEADQLLVDSVVLNAQLYLDGAYARCTDLIANGDEDKCWGDSATDKSYYEITSMESNNYFGANTINNPFAGVDANIDDFTPSLVGDVANGFNSIRITFDVIGAGTANSVAARLPSGVVALKSDDIYTVTMQLPVPANESSHQILLPIDGTRSMTGDLNLDDHGLASVDFIRGAAVADASCSLTVDSAAALLSGATIPLHADCPNLQLADAIIGTKQEASLPYQIQVIGDLEVSNDLRVFNDVTVGADVVANAYYYESDERVKENLQQITQAQMELLLQLVTVSYNRIDAEKQKFGFIAQDVQEKFPGLVTSNDQGILAVDYQAIIPLLLSVVNYQQIQIDSLIDQQSNIDE